jgi:hypothetical protein
MTFYGLATIALVAVSLLVIGGVTALIAERRGQDWRIWFVIGAGCVAIATQLPQAPQLIVATVVPLGTAATTLVDPTRTRAFERAQVRSWWWLRIFSLGLVGILVYACSVETMGALKRTGMAVAVVENVETIEWAVTAYGLTTYGVAVRYSFQIDKARFEGRAARDWTRSDLVDLRVCYDPADPAGSHSLHLHDFACGTVAFDRSDD